MQKNGNKQNQDQTVVP